MQFQWKNKRYCPWYIDISIVEIIFQINFELIKFYIGKTDTIDLIKKLKLSFTNKICTFGFQILKMPKFP